MIKTHDYIPEKFRENFIKPGVKIKVTHLKGCTRLSEFFNKQKCDVAYLRFFKHPFFENLMVDFFLFKNGKILRNENGFIQDHRNKDVTSILLEDLRFIESSELEILNL